MGPASRKQTWAGCQLDLEGGLTEVQQVLDSLDWEAVDKELNQSQSGIYIDTGLGSAANIVIPANAGI